MPRFDPVPFLRRLPKSVRDRFEIQGVLGAGGFAFVLRARDKSLDRKVVLKCFEAERHSKTARERLKREATTLARLSHPNLLEILDWISDPALEVLVFPDQSGVSLLETVWGSLPLAPERVRSILRDCLEGLSELHAQGILHRDLKPANLLVLPEGRIQLIDLGLAGIPEGSRALTETGVLVGTPGFVAPERIRAKEPTPKSDLYSLGAIAYELLTGVHPFSRSTVSESLQAHLSHHPKPPHALRPEISQEFSHWVLRLLAKDPKDRPKSAARAQRELEGIKLLEGPHQVREKSEARTLVAPPPRAKEPDPPASKRFPNRGKITVGILGLVAFLGALSQTTPPQNEPAPKSRPFPEACLPRLRATFSSLDSPEIHRRDPHRPQGMEKVLEATRPYLEWMDEVSGVPPLPGALLSKLEDLDQELLELGLVPLFEGLRRPPALEGLAHAPRVPGLLPGIPVQAAPRSFRAWSAAAVRQAGKLERILTQMHL